MDKPDVYSTLSDLQVHTEELANMWLEYGDSKAVLCMLHKMTIVQEKMDVLTGFLKEYSKAAAERVE